MCSGPMLPKQEGLVLVICDWWIELGKLTSDCLVLGAFIVPNLEQNKEKPVICNL